jgi:hypothetical protein
VEETAALIILVTMVIYVAVRLIVFWKASRSGDDRSER